MKKVISFEAIDPTAAQRARMDAEYVDELVTCYMSQCEMPPLDIFGEKGAKTYYLADGLNRMTAAKKAGLKGLECEIHEGDFEDALLFAAGANNQHGARPTLADKRKKVTDLLKSKRWKSKSDRWIGDTCGVGHSMVGTIRAQLAQLANQPVDEPREGKDGRKRKPKRAESNGEGEPEAGEELFDFNAYNSARGTLRKLIDRMYIVHKLVNPNGSVKQDKEWDEIAKNLEKFHADFTKRWGYLAGTPFPKQ
jgi:hypothetical protein